MKIILLGKRFGRLLITDFAPSDSHGQAQWVCLCDCGNIKTIRAHKLKAGTTVSCGCYSREVTAAAQKKLIANSVKHGYFGTPEYQSYHQAQYRCRRPKHHAWHRYGGRGIEFKFGSFGQFIEHIGPRPAGTTLDRYPNNDGHYELGNVRWATPKQQAMNRSPQ